MRVLIVKASAFGDILHALPIVLVLQAECPSIQVDWVVEEPFAELLEGNPLINRVIVVSTKRWRHALTELRTYQEIRAAIRMLRLARYDLVIDLQGNLKSGIITGLSKALDKVGFALPQLQERINALFTRRRIPLPAGVFHITDQYQAIATGALRLPNIAPDPEGCCIFPSPQNFQEASTLLGNTTGLFVIAIHQGTTWQTKYWDVESWAALIWMLQDRVPFLRVVLTCGSVDEVEMAQHTKDAIGFGVDIQIIKRVPIMTLAALYKQVPLVMGGDTGPLHLAAAVGTPTCSIYRSSDGLRSGPRGVQHMIVQVPMACTPCFKTSCPDDEICRMALTPQLVFDSVWHHITVHNLL